MRYMISKAARAFSQLTILLLILAIHSSAQTNPEPSSVFYENIRHANDGKPYAMYNVGHLYRLGIGVPENKERAIYWLLKAAEANHPTAQFELAEMHQKGEGTQIDVIQAIFWYRKSAEQGWAPAQINLGAMYVEGIGVLQDYAEAYAWFNLASIPRGNGPTAHPLAREHEEVARGNRDSVAKFMSAEARMRGQERSRELKALIDQKSGNGDSVIDDNGTAPIQTYQPKAAADRNSPKDRFNEAEKFAQRGDMEAQSYLGLFYATGAGVVQDNTQAVFWWRKASEQGHANSQLLLGDMYSKGQGVERDIAQALHWWRKAAEQGDGSAQLRIGASYIKGEGVAADLVEGYAWVNLAAYSNETYRETLSKIGGKMTADAIQRAQRRTRELQKLIEERKAGKGK